MILYVVSQYFPGRTFVVLVKATDTVARIRAQVLHYLYQIGFDALQFRLRYNDAYIRDAFNVEDCSIHPNSVLFMEPLSNRFESISDIRSLSSSNSSSIKWQPGQHGQVRQAIETEIKMFRRREKFVETFHGFNWLHLLLTFLCIFTTYYYCFVWHLLLFLFVYCYCPKYCMLTGFTGKWSIHKKRFCAIYIIVGLLWIIGNAIMTYFELRKIVMYGCSAGTINNFCSITVVFSCILYIGHALFLACLITLCIVLEKNFRIQVGDYMEQYLVQTRDIYKVLESARSKVLKDRRMAAFELATLAASGDDNKFRIIVEGGLPVLIAMSVSGDTLVQSHAVEALAELMTVPSIQATLVESNGQRVLTRLLRSSSPTKGTSPNPKDKLVRDAATALFYLVCDTTEHHRAVVENRGLEDLCYGAQYGPPAAQKALAGVFLELSFNEHIRHVLIRNERQVLPALISLAKSEDEDTQRFALQTLEILAIEDPLILLHQADVLPLLLDIPKRTVNVKLYVLSGKLLLYFTDSPESRRHLINQKGVENSLRLYAQSGDPTLQKVICKIIFSFLEHPATRQKAKSPEFKNLLQRIRDEALDAETIEMADQSLQLLHTDDDLVNLPSSSVMDKMLYDHMETRIADIRKETGSKASLQSTEGSIASLRERNQGKKRK